MFSDPKTIVDAKTILPRLLTTPEFIPAVATTLLVIILVNVYERLAGTKKADPAAVKC
ncbi:MAG: hypothetical protein ACHQ7N_11850 [Candidatus Methylomirabilales bacterium]